MTEYDTLLKVEYFLPNYFDYTESGAMVYGTKAIPELVEAIKDKKLVIALDQATNKTGVCILNFDTRELIGVLDLINSGFPSKQLYFESLYDFLANHIRDANIIHFIYEIPIEHSKNVRTLALLEAMRVFIKNFRNRLPSLTDKNMVEIYVSAWRGHFLADKKYDGLRKNREDAKESTREEVCARFPDVYEYVYKRKEPPDSCDAVGIAFGALEEIYSKTFTNLRRVNKTMPVRNVKHYNVVRQGKIEDIINILKTDYVLCIHDFEFLEFNSEMSLEENAKRYCSSTRTLGILLVPPTDVKTIQILKWETGKELSDAEMYAVFCRRTS